jgi:FMN phosphatase YigB (HAD superfamily)
MPTIEVPASTPIQGVIFDLHCTLIHSGEPEAWLELAWRKLNRPGDVSDALDAELLGKVYDVLDHAWDLAREIDPTARRDLDPATHERVFTAVLGRVSGLDPELISALYATLADVWMPYDDTLPVLQALHEQGCPVAVLSNVGFDVRPVLDRSGISSLIAGLALSYELGAVKPEAAIFHRALELIDVDAGRALMVGDSFADDGAAAALGIRSLILPRSPGGIHGLDTVLRLVG